MYLNFFPKQDFLPVAILLLLMWKTCHVSEAQLSDCPMANITTKCYRDYAKIGWDKNCMLGTRDSRTPFLRPLLKEFRPGASLAFKAKATATRSEFNINLLTGEYTGQLRDVALHFSPRYDQEIFIFNSQDNENFLHEERAGLSGLSRVREFDVDIYSYEKCLQIIINGISLTCFSHRKPLRTISHILILGDLSISEITYNCVVRSGYYQADSKCKALNGHLPVEDDLHFIITYAISNLTWTALRFIGSELYWDGETKIKAEARFESTVLGKMDLSKCIGYSFITETFLYIECSEEIPFVCILGTERTEVKRTGTMDNCSITVTNCPTATNTPICPTTTSTTICPTTITTTPIEPTPCVIIERNEAIIVAICILNFLIVVVLIPLVLYVLILKRRLKRANNVNGGQDTFNNASVNCASCLSSSKFNLNQVFNNHEQLVNDQLNRDHQPLEDNLDDHVYEEPDSYKPTRVAFNNRNGLQKNNLNTFTEEKTRLKAHFNVDARSNEESAYVSFRSREPQDMSTQLHEPVYVELDENGQKYSDKYIQGSQGHLENYEDGGYLQKK